MEVEKVKSNFAITFQNFSDLNERIKMFHFYSESSCDEITSFLKNHNPFLQKFIDQGNSDLLDTSENEIELQFTVISLATLQRQRLRRKWLKSDLNTIKNDVKNYLVRSGLAFDVKETRYEVIVRNKFSPQNDVKTTCFNSNKSFLEVFNDIKEEITSFPVEEDIFASNNKKKVFTHYIIFKRAGTKERRKQPSKSFSVYMPNYSSKEIMSIILTKQGDDKKCNQNTLEA